MKDLSQCKWKAFMISDVFQVKNSVRLTQSDMRPGERPFVGATELNNGITAFVSNTNDSLDYNVLGVNYNGSVVENFYHPYEAIFSDDVKRLHFITIDGNKYHYLFVKNMILQQKKKFQYGYKFNAQRMMKQYIMLPVLEDGTPDYEFMEEYMRQKEQLLLEQIEHKLFQDIKDLEKVLPPTCQPKEWKSFEVKQIFSSIQRGKRLKNDDHIEGSVPYVSSSSVNNGVDDFIGNEKKVRRFSDCLTIANSGSVGSTFYHPYEFVASDHVTQLKQPRANKYVYLYLSQMVSRISEKYSFNREINDSRINNEMVMLPVNADGEPDYEYMEQKMRYIEAKMLLNYYRSKFK